MHQCTAEDDGRSFKDSTYDILCYEQYTVDKVCVNKNISYIIYIYLELPTYIYIFPFEDATPTSKSKSHLSQQAFKTSKMRCGVCIAAVFCHAIWQLESCPQGASWFSSSGPPKYFWSGQGVTSAISVGNANVIHGSPLGPWFWQLFWESLHPTKSNTCFGWWSAVSGKHGKVCAT